MDTIIIVIVIVAIVLTILLTMQAGTPTDPDTIKATASYIDTQCPNSKVITVWTGVDNITIECEDGGNTNTPVDVILEAWYNK